MSRRLLDASGPLLTSIFIIEDHPLVREGLAHWFSQSGSWKVLGMAGTLAEAKRVLAGITPDIILLDIQLDDGWGLDIIPWLASENPGSPQPLTAVYSAFDDYPHVSAAVALGVRAYVCKRHGEQKLEAALQTVLAGKTYIDNTAGEKLQNVTALISLLTKRESEILTLVKSGLSNKEVATRLGLSARTVENILSCIYDKTGIRSRRELERL